MLKKNYDQPPSEFDQQVFEKLVPADHYLRRIKAAVDFTRCRALVADCYSPNMGRGAIDPVRLIKLLLLQFHYGLSDDRVIAETQVNVAFRFFLDLSVEATLPEPSLLSQFRTRLGEERFALLFQEILAQARAAGLVKDRLRLKDATHIIANIAVPATIQLVAQIRTQLLDAAEVFAADEVAAHRQHAADLRQMTTDLKNEVRLLRRIEHLRELVVWSDQWCDRLANASPRLCTPAQQEKFEEALKLAHKILKDREAGATDKVVSLTDPEARRNKHGQYYDGYLLDVSLDADSELICGVDVLPSNADEAANTVSLIEQEERAHQNDIESVSLDGIGYNGIVLKKLSDDADGPQVTVYVPVKELLPQYPELFQPDDFLLDETKESLTCPQGKVSRTRCRDRRDHGYVFQFKASDCRNCPLRNQCLAPGNQNGRRVKKNDFQSQYEAAKKLATTEEYKRVRKQHPRIERKLNELVRWHDGRRVRYRGRHRVKIQYLLLAVVVNCKRITRLLTAAPIPQPA